MKSVTDLLECDGKYQYLDCTGKNHNINHKNLSLVLFRFKEKFNNYFYTTKEKRCKINKRNRMSQEKKYLNRNVFPFKEVEEDYREREKNIEFKKDGKKIFTLEMFAYPSGNAHMGHVRNYTIVDLYARYYFLLGYNVLCPKGFDAFGLPAENAAIERGIHPRDWTEKNIKEMSEDLDRLGFLYTPNTLIKTCDVEYYKHQQKLFIDFYKFGLIERKESWVNWDPVDKTVLANEQVMSDGTGWRSKAKVERRKIHQWFFKISKYSERLLKGLKKLNDWPKNIKEMQEQWIGKSIGYNIIFKTKDGLPIKIFTTRPETVNHCTFIALSKESEIRKIFDDSQIFAGEDENGKKIGVVINPFTNKEIPVYIASYVLNDYGTGAVMGVPLYDKRDRSFAIDFGIEIETSEEKINLEDEEAVKKIRKQLKLEEVVNYKLRDWCISRQRYWGCPIPAVHCLKCGIVVLDHKDLPVILPYEVNFNGKGNPLETNEDFLTVICPKCKSKAKRETDTMDTFVDSSWYFLRFPCVNFETKPFDEQTVHSWLPVSMYVGGAEHATLHLIYSRFFTMALHDMGHLKFEEPFTKLINQGMVCSYSYFDESGKYYHPDEIEEIDNRFFFEEKEVKRSPYPVKMSKSWKNTVSPSDMIKSYGSNCLRFFILSDSPVNAEFVWNTNALAGCSKFINKIWRTTHDLKEYEGTESVPETFNEDISEMFNKINLAIETTYLNLYISHLRVLCAKIIDGMKKNYKADFLKEMYKRFLIYLWPVCPQVSAICFEIMFEKDITKEAWQK